MAEFRFAWPKGKPEFTAEWFLPFFERLTLPEGTPTRVEGHVQLLAREGFAPHLRELLVLIPKGNWKTTITAAAMDWHLLTVQNANGYIGAADRAQADEMYRFMVHFIESEPDLDPLFDVRRSTREIRVRGSQGFARVLASDDSKQGGKRQGLNGTFFDLDELHAHENDNLYIDARSGLFKRNGRLWTISTAGYDRESVLGRLRASFLSFPDVRTGLRVLPDGSVESHVDGRLTIARSPDGRSVMLEWACRDDDDVNDAAVVKLANPASTVTVESIEDARNAPGITPWAFLRYRCNIWTLGHESWLPIGAWDALRDPDASLDPALPLFGALDMARYRDCAALVVVQPRDGAPAVVKAWIWKGTPERPVPYGPVMDIIRELHAEFDLQAFGYDPRYFDQAGDELAAEGVAMELIPQSIERQTMQAGELRRAILEGAFAWNPADEFAAVLAQHVIAPIPKEVGADRFKLDKPARSVDIDAAEALGMAFSLVDLDGSEPLVAWA